MNSSMRHEFCCPVKPFSNETQRPGEFPMEGIGNSFFFFEPCSYLERNSMSNSCLISWCALNTCSVPFWNAFNVGEGRSHMQCLRSSEYVLSCLLWFWISSEIITSRKCKPYLDFAFSCGCQKQNSWFRLLNQETVYFCSVLTVKWSPTALLSTWDSWGSHLASLTSTYNLLQPPSCKIESSFSSGDLSHSRWQGRSSPEDFSLPLSSLLSPFLSVLVPTSLCPLLQAFVWPNSAFVKKSLLQKCQHLIHLETPTWMACIWGSVFL